MTSLGKCSTHPKVPAIVTEQVNGSKKRRFCRDCWDHHKYTKLGLKPCMLPTSTTIHISSLRPITRREQAPVPQPIIRAPQPIIRRKP